MTQRNFRTVSQFAIIGSLGLLLGALPSAGFAQGTPFLPSPVQMVSTIPSNGDVNPYGVAFVPNNFPGGGVLNPGDILVSNFNNSFNLQGTGGTIVRINPAGKQSLFFPGQAPIGLSAALNVLRAGFVVVGNFPTADGTCATAQPGSLLIVDKNGKQVANLAGTQFVNGPWGMTVNDKGAAVQIFVSNALAGNVTRIDLLLTNTGFAVQDAVVVASGFMHRCDPAALVVAPTGLVYDAPSDTLFVASTEDNAVFGVPHAGRTEGSQGTGQIIYKDAVHLHGALAMAKAPNGHLLVTNSDVINSDPNQPSEIVEFTTNGQFVKEIPVDAAQGGSFGLQVGISGNTARLAAVNDNTASLTIWTIPLDLQ